MNNRLISYEAQIEKKGKDSKNLIIEVRKTETGLVVYVEGRTTLVVNMGKLYWQEPDWDEDEANMIADEAIKMTGDGFDNPQNIRPRGIGIIHHEKGGFTMVWNCEVPEEKQEQETTSVDMSKAVARA